MSKSRKKHEEKMAAELEQLRRDSHAAGAFARSGGLTLEDNPYDLGCLAGDAWADGWRGVDAKAPLIGTPAWREARAAASPEDTLEQPAGTATETAASAIDWPESTETRQLDVELADDEAHEQALEMIKEMRRMEELKQKKKASAKEYDNQIEEAEQSVQTLTDVVQTKRLRREVECFWMFEINGLDSFGNPITHTGMKTLFRRDSGAVVESLPISQEDRQMVLPLDDAEALKLQIAKLKEAGWEVMEAPDGIEHDCPFQAVNADSGVTVPVQADSLAAAVAHVLAHRNSPVQNSVSDGYHNGYAARAAGLKEEANPHAHGTKERDAWLDGWRDAAADDEEAA